MFMILQSCLRKLVKATKSLNRLFFLSDQKGRENYERHRTKGKTNHTKRKHN